MAVTSHMHHQWLNMAHTRIKKVSCHRFICSYTHSTCNFFLGRWEGSATDNQIWEAALDCGLEIPDDYYYLADARYPDDDPWLLTPYHGVWYHFTEWSWANQKRVILIPKYVFIDYVLQAMQQEGTIQPPTCIGLQHYWMNLWSAKMQILNFATGTRI